MRHVGTSRPGQLIAAVGGAALIASLFLPWADAGDASRTGWELLALGDGLLLICGAAAILAALTGAFVAPLRMAG